MRRGWPVLAVAVGVTSWDAAADQPHATARLQLSRGQETQTCIDAGSLRRAVEQRLQRDVFRAADSEQVDVRVTVKLDRADSGFAATVLLETQHGNPIGTRRLTTETQQCSALDESLVLALALMLDIRREQVAAVDQRERLKDPAAYPGASPPPTRAPLRPSGLPVGGPVGAATMQPAPWRFMGGVGAVVGVGLLPDVAPGVRLGAGVAPPRIGWVEADATALAGTEAADEVGAVRLAWWGLGLYLCPLEFRGAPASGVGCLGNHVGWLRSTGVGFDDNSRSTRITYSPGLRGRGALRVTGPVALRAGIELLVPVVRDRFVYAQPNGSRSELFRADPIAAVAELGLGLEID